MLAEATRQTRAAGVDPGRVNDVAAQVTTRVLTGGDCVPVGVDTELSGPDAPVVPEGLRRTDGTSVFRVAKAQLFTTTGGAGRRAADRRRRRPDRRETRHRQRMSSWRCWNGRPTTAAGP